METLIDIVKVLGRIVTIIPWLLIVTLIMGKRSIGELPVFDFLIVLVLGAVAGADIADPKVPHLFTFLSITAIGILQIIVSKMKIKHRQFGKLITFEPTIVIKNGEFLVGNMKRIRYSLDNVLQMLRENDVFDVSEVELAIVEQNGKLTVSKKPSKYPVTIEDLGLNSAKSKIAYPIIVEGQMESNVLSQFELTENWLVQELRKKDLGLDDIFFASINQEHELQVSLKYGLEQGKPEIKH